MNTRWGSRAALIGLAAMLLGAGCHNVPVEHTATKPCADDAIHSEHRVETSEGPLAYDACVGTLRVAGEGGTGAADLFYTAYFARTDEAERPLSFVWNGGPGADSRLLHFDAMGPMLIRAGEAVENAETPLMASDLVFLDPAGTGFSRARTPADAERLYSTTGDIAATSQFVMRFLERYGRGDAPLYLFGESFGTWRAAGTAEALIDKGVPVAGVGLISGGIPLGEDTNRALSRALSLPNRTATALALGRLDPALQAKGDAIIAQATRWAREKWYPALADPASLTPGQKAAIAARLARYHGMRPDQVDPETLWVSPRDFRTGLIPGKTLDVFDMRVIGAANHQSGGEAVLSYYRDTLGYRVGQYAGIEVESLPVGESWQYDQAEITKESLARAMAGEGPPSPSQPWTIRAMRKSPGMQVFVAAGIYDSLNSCAANEATVARLPGGIAFRIALHCYRGGHMMYDVPAARREFANDLTAFIRNSHFPQ
ncbi:S10 family serine carboxypeptidase-like protein [Alteriqipengyuania sp. 357]